MTGTDFLSAKGARLLIDKIRAYWRDRGYYGIAIERYYISEGTYGIRSNIGPDGFPPRLIGKWRK